MSAAELLHGLQPACASSARCKPAAMGQCARGRQWWCRRDAPAHRHRHRQTRHVHLLRFDVREYTLCFVSTICTSD